MMAFSPKDQLLLEDEATWVGQAAGTPLRECAADTLWVLATHYLDYEFDLHFDAKYYQQFACLVGVAGRLRMLAWLMGKEAFDALEAEKAAEFTRICAQADAAVRALTPCVTCGRSRSLADKIEGSPLCGDCGNEKWQRERPSGGTGGHEDPPDDELPCDDDDDLGF